MPTGADIRGLIFGMGNPRGTASETAASRQVPSSTLADASSGADSGEEMSMSHAERLEQKQAIRRDRLQTRGFSDEGADQISKGMNPTGGTDRHLLQGSLGGVGKPGTPLSAKPVPF